MTIKRFHTRSLSSIFTSSASWILILVSTLTIMTGISACTDDKSPFEDNNPSKDGKLITFSIKTSSDWNNGSPTRSGLLTGTTQQSLKTLTLSSEQSDNLYLVPLVIDGIDVKQKHTTRSTLVDNDNMESFGVFASMHPDSSDESDTFKPDYMYNVEVTKENGWAPAEEYLWPGNAFLHINAYSPYSAVDALRDAEGITTLPSKDDTGSLSLSWITPAEVADQQDLMWASPEDASSSPCELVFNHALTAIRFVTGAEMSPCTVKSIKITDIVSSGTLNLETGEWTLNASADDMKDFSVSPEISLSAADGSNYVAPGTAITSDDQTFLLIPQTLSDSSQIELTIETNGSEATFSASLNGQTWTAGKTVIYRLSANADSDTLILQILDENGQPTTTLQSHYTGVPLVFSVVSHSEATVDGQVSTENVPWKAEFVDDNGNVIERPQWITDFAMSGDGDGEYTEPTVMQEPTFATMSDDTRTLRSTADINSTSGYTPYNLANSTGASTVENTANCYVVSAPGSYSIPLVYGNAIKNSTANPTAYQWSTHTSHVLTHFLNHLGNPISDPYIYNNSGCQPKDAYLVWEGRLCLIENVKLSDDKQSLTFEVPATYIRQGDALIAVRDNDGNIMWSWQIWVTPHRPEDNLRTITYEGAQHQLMALNIGELSGGDDTYFEAQSTKVRFTQITADGTTPKSLVIEINRDAKHVITPFTYNYFQWGRKDPIISLIQEWYKADHTEITTIKTQAYSARPTDIDFVSTCIRTPDVFWTSSHDGNEPSYDYVNLWNVKSNDKNGVKSVYDPSPVGFMVPGTSMLAFVNNTYNHTYIGDDPNYPRLSYTLDDGELLIPLLGYRSSNDGKEAASLLYAPLWLNSASQKDGRNIPFQNTTFTQQTMARAMGYGIRPMKEP